MVIPTPDSGILKRVYANLVGGGGFVSLDVPDKVLKRLYTYGSLTDTDRGVEFEVKNRLQDAEFAGIDRLELDGGTVDPERVLLETADGETLRLEEVTPDDPVPFPVGRTVVVVVEEMEGDLMGQYFEVTGPIFGRYVLVDEFERLSEPADPEAVLIKARSI